MSKPLMQLTASDVEPEDAFVALTSGARRVLGSAAPSGVIAAGEAAHLVGWSDDPLGEDSKVHLVISDGRVFDLRDPGPCRDLGAMRAR